MENKIITKVLKKVAMFIVVGLVTLGCLFVFDELPTFADSGHSVSHSSSHSSSSHSSSSSSRSSSRRSSSSGSSYRSGSSYSSSGSSSSASALAGVIAFFIIIIIIIISSRLKGTQNSTSIPEKSVDDSNVENKIKEFLPDFNKKEFIDEGFSIYEDIQEAWMNFKLEDVKDVMTDELYSMYETQLAAMEVKGEQNIMKDITFKNGYLTGVVSQNGTITITTRYVIELYDYMADRETGKLTRGENRKIRVLYEMKFRKSLDEKAQIDHCPNCGAEIKMNSTGICEYCGSRIVSENSKWVLTEKQVINQNYM